MAQHRVSTRRRHRESDVVVLVSNKAHILVKMREMRATQQSRDLNLAIVLISSVVMFLCCHIPRLITSVYEAANIHSILHCREQGMDKTPLWFMYVTATVQLLMVRLRPSL